LQFEADLGKTERPYLKSILKSKRTGVLLLSKQETLSSIQQQPHHFPTTPPKKIALSPHPKKEKKNSVFPLALENGICPPWEDCWGP
jgi:hypothetical protein